MWKKCKVVMIATNDKTYIELNHNTGELGYFIGFMGDKNNYIPNHERAFKQFQHLYILSDDEIKENTNTFNQGINGDWYYNTKYQKIANTGDITEYDFKIIATTDDLRLFGEPTINGTKSFKGCIPSISQSFIEYYINEYNKGNVIKKVMVEYEDYGFPIYENPNLKLNNDNTISIKASKTSWTREEVSDIIRDYRNRILALISMKHEVTNNFTEEFINNNL